MKKYDAVHEKSEAELNYIIQRLNADVNLKRNDFENEDSVGMENQQNNSNGNNVNVDTKSVSSIKLMENQTNVEIENDIYYRRELLINSLEGRRIDLMTITSFQNIQNEYEYKFPDLFPMSNAKRCHLFKNKKVSFLELTFRNIANAI